MEDDDPYIVESTTNDLFVLEPMSFQQDPDGGNNEDTHSFSGLFELVEDGDEIHIFGDENEALERFMRNEIQYDEFMRLSGGLALEEEAADFEEVFSEMDLLNRSAKRPRNMSTVTASSNEVTDSEADDSGKGYVWDMDDIDEEDRPGSSKVKDNFDDMEKQRPAKTKKHVDLNKTWDENDENRLLGIPLELRTLDTMEDQFESKGSKRNKLTKSLNALLGQANVIYAKGKTKEALTMLLEIVRQAPRNSEAYKILADIYEESGELEWSLQYSLFAAHLCKTTDSNEWARLGDLAAKFGRWEGCAACYGKALRENPGNRTYYERRINALKRTTMQHIEMLTRLQAAQCVDSESGSVDFEWYADLIKSAAEYFISRSDDDRAMSALEAYVLRSREFGKKADSQHNILIDMWMTRSRFTDAAKSIFALCPGITALDMCGISALEIQYGNCKYSVDPFPPVNVKKFVIGEDFCNAFLTTLIICFIRLERKDLAEMLVNEMFERGFTNKVDETSSYIEISRTYQDMKYFSDARKYVKRLLNLPHFENDPAVWFTHGQMLTLQNKSSDACAAFKRVLDLESNHVDARISLSKLQQSLGLTEEAFETLRDHDLDSANTLPDERLLLRLADFLFEHKRTEQYVKCARMLLVPHFYVIHTQVLSRRRLLNSSGILKCSYGIRKAALNELRGSPFEKYVKRLGCIAQLDDRQFKIMSDIQIHDNCLKLIEALLKYKRYQEAAHVACYSFLHPGLTKVSRFLDTFQCLVVFCAMKAEIWGLAFEVLRWLHYRLLFHEAKSRRGSQLKSIRIVNAMNFIFCHSQNVCYHRYIMRTLSKFPKNLALKWISGNNSLITGSYRHALGEYLRVWPQSQDDPLMCFLIALTFLHISCKKYLCNRHMIVLRGLAFMKQYEKLRRMPQECYYNFGRMFHQLNILPMAIHYYEKCLQSKPPRISIVNTATLEDEIVEASKFDLRRLAAHNLVLIYMASGNVSVARQIMRQHLVI